MMSLSLKPSKISKFSEEQLYGMLVGAMGILFILAAIRVNSQEDYSEFWLIVGWGGFFCLVGLVSYFWEKLKIPERPQRENDPAKPSFLAKMLASYYRALHTYEENHPVAETKPLSKKAQKRLKQAKPKQTIHRPAVSNSFPHNETSSQKRKRKANH